MKTRKLLVAMLSVIMILSMIPAIGLTASAAEGAWDTHRQANEYGKDLYRGEAGYYYDAEGLHVTPP